MYKQQVDLRIRNEVHVNWRTRTLTYFIYFAFTTNKSFTVKVYYASSTPYTEPLPQRSFTLTSRTCSYF